MPQYFYTAKSLEGEKRTGTQEAKDQRELAKILHQEGYTLVSASLESEEKEGIKLDFLKIGRKVSLKEKIFFTRNLRIMIVAGVPLPRALMILSQQTKNQSFKKALLDINEWITKGRSFSESLAEHSNIFSELFHSMIKVGEETGTLDEVLRNITEQIEKENELKSRVKGAMMYPAVIIVAMLIIGALMLTMVVPKLTETFEDLGVELPLTTRIVISLGNIMAQKWPLIILAVFFFIFAIWMALRTKKGKQILDALLLRVPLISSLVRKTNSAYTVRTLSSLLASGMPIVRALEIVSETMGNFYFREAVKKAADKVSKGAKLSEAFEPYQNLYPSLVVQMIEVGEETGETSDILKKLAEFFEEEVTATTKNLASIIEPLLMIIVGGAVGFFAISMFQPMYSVLGTL